MPGSALEADGFDYYLSELRRGALDPYIAYRVYDRSWRVPQDDADLLRRATIRLIEIDPWFLATAMPHFLSSLTPTDLERVTPLVGAGPASVAAPILRARLWYYASRDRPAQLRRALSYLRQVPTARRDPTWHEMLVGCYRFVDYAKYKRAFPKRLALTPAAWRAAGLNEFLNVLASKKDWTAYDRFRPEWDRLPQGHHGCECHINDIYTNDGLRAVAARRWDAIPAALTNATSVRGCPHLCSAGMRLDLVRLLLSKRKHLADARAYLECAATFTAIPGDLRVRIAKLPRLRE